MISTRRRHEATLLLDDPVITISPATPCFGIFIWVFVSVSNRFLVAPFAPIICAKNILKVQ
jgi:hypothetical protein